jgi:flagellar motor switch protein FliN/FliY
MSDMEILQTLGEETAVELSQTLSGLLGREVSVGFSQVSEMDSTALASSLDSACLFSVLKGSGGVDGTAFLLTKEKDSSIIADLLIGQDGTNAPDKMTELHLSAFGEVVHQITEVFTKGGKKIAGPKAIWEVVNTEVVDLAGAPQHLSAAGSAWAVFSFGVFVQDLFSSVLLFCLSESVVTRITSGGGKPAASVPVGNVQTGVSNLNTQSRAGGAAMQQLENEFSGSTRPAGGNIGLLLDVPLKLTVELGRTTKLVKEILALAPGSVVELDKLAGEAVDILVNEKLIAKGEVVVIDENFGVRITEIINPEERLTAVQA